MDKVGLNYNFENLTPEVFRDFLRELQEKGPYRWPNLYFAWEKSDGSLLMVGTNSTQMYHMIVRECDPESWINKTRASYGQPFEYSSFLYCINPQFGYSQNGKPFDPVERLVDKVSACKYVGHWRDPDVLMDDWHGFNRVLACGRWALAMQKIGLTESLVDLSKLADYLRREMILEFGSPEECLEYFNTHDGQKLESVEELKAFQGEYGFGIGSKWYHVCFDEALDVVEKPLSEKLKDATDRANSQDNAPLRGKEHEELF